jgi:multiple antibiotic resistance protein
VGLAPLFVALTQGMTIRERRKVAIRACLVAVGILTLFGVAGRRC